MAHLSSFVAAGLASILAWDFFVAPRATDTASHVTASALASAATELGASAPARAAQSNTVVNRARKGDRLGAASLPQGPRPTIARMDIGPGSSIQVRSRTGDTLFELDPVAGRSLIAKNVLLPQLTLPAGASAPVSASRPATPPAPSAVPEVSPQRPLAAPPTTTVSTDRKPAAKRPAGCDPAFSPITAPQLGHIFGRCVTSLEPPTRLALAQ